MIRIALLGSTGSIGRSTLEVVQRHPDLFRIVGMTANRSVATLREQVEAFNPKVAILTDTEVPFPDPSLTSSGGFGDVVWQHGREELLELCRSDEVDVVVNAVVGAAGLEPTLAALEAGKRVALANKESLVAAGPLVVETARRGGGELTPIDSEHSAILQCLESADRESVHRLVITASGGPFRGWTRHQLESVTPEDALKHPTWSMGAKITVDSATLANKALEVIEAHYLYSMGYDRIDVVVHPQSIIHSFVEFRDGSVLAQLGFPTMELPILYALKYPTRVADETLRTFDPVRSSPLTFEEVDHDAFPMFGIGVEAGSRGGAAPAVFNAAKEVAVTAFLDGQLSFLGMAEAVGEAVERLGDRAAGSLQEILSADLDARQFVSRALDRSLA